MKGGTPASATSGLRVSDADLPELFRRADGNARSAQARFQAYTMVRLVIAVCVAVLAGSGSRSLLAVACLALFIGVLWELFQSRTGSTDSSWLASRAIAEAVKHLAWKYMVGAEPFPCAERANGAGAVSDADVRLLNALRSLSTHGGAAIGPRFAMDVEPDVSEQLTNKMRRVRGLKLPERRDLYLTERVADQTRWYATKAAENKQSADRWDASIIALEVLGFAVLLLSLGSSVLGTAEVCGVCSDAGFAGATFGGVGALIAALTAWTQTKRYRTLEAMYTQTAVDLQAARTEGQLIDGEEEWKLFVQRVEAAMVTERTIWLRERQHDVPLAAS